MSSGIHFPCCALCLHAHFSRIDDEFFDFIHHNITIQTTSVLYYYFFLHLFEAFDRLLPSLTRCRAWEGRPSMGMNMHKEGTEFPAFKMDCFVSTLTCYPAAIPNTYQLSQKLVQETWKAQYHGWAWRHFHRNQSRHGISTAQAP